MSSLWHKFSQCPNGYYLSGFNECLSCHELCVDRDMPIWRLAHCEEACPNEHAQLLSSTTTTTTTTTTTAPVSSDNLGKDITIIAVIFAVILVFSIFMFVLIQRSKRKKRSHISQQRGIEEGNARRIVKKKTEGSRRNSSSGSAISTYSHLTGPGHTGRIARSPERSFSVSHRECVQPGSGGDIAGVFGVGARVSVVRYKKIPVPQSSLAPTEADTQIKTIQNRNDGNETPTNVGVISSNNERNHVGGHFPASTQTETKTLQFPVQVSSDEHDDSITSDRTVAFAPSRPSVLPDRVARTFAVADDTSENEASSSSENEEYTL